MSDGLATMICIAASLLLLISAVFTAIMADTEDRELRGIATAGLLVCGFFAMVGIMVVKEWPV